MNAVQELAADFNVCARVEAGAVKVMRERDIDIAIAQRGGDAASERGAIAAKNDSLTAWYRTYEDKKNAAAALLVALNIAPHELKAVL